MPIQKAAAKRKSYSAKPNPAKRKCDSTKPNSRRCTNYGWPVGPTFQR
jgi:hypothetical protein